MRLTITITLLLVQLSGSTHQEGRMKIIPITANTLVRFEPAGKLLPISSLREINVRIDAAELMTLAKNILEAIETAKKHLSCYDPENKQRPSCNTILRDTQDRINKKVFLIAPMLTERQSRKRRALDFLGDIIGGLTGLQTNKDKKKAQKNMKILQADQASIVKSLENQKNVAVEVFGSLKETNEMIRNISSEVENRMSKLAGIISETETQHLVVDKLAQAMRDFDERADAAMNLFTTGIIRDEVIKFKTIETMFETMMKENEDETERFPFTSIAELVYKNKVKVNVKGHFIVATIEIPLTNSETWELFNVHRMPMVTDGIVKTLKEGREKFLTRSPSGSTSTLESLSECYQKFNEVHICQLHEPILSRDEGSHCITAAFNDSPLMNEACAKQIRAARMTRTMVIRTTPNEIWVFPIGKTKATAKCGKDHPNSAQISSSVSISTATACSVTINKIEFRLVPTTMMEKAEHIQAAFDITWESNKHTISLPALPHMAETHVQELEKIGHEIKELNEQHIHLQTLDLKDTSDWQLYGGLVSVIVSTIILMGLCVCVCCVIKR